MRSTVEKVQQLLGWSVSRILSLLEVASTTFYRLVGKRTTPSPHRPVQPFEVLPHEREELLRWARRYPALRHRELAYRMIDEGGPCLSPSAVYRILKEEGLVKEWVRQKRERAQMVRATAPDQKWLTDITYVKVAGQTYYLVTFIDEYSRYITYSELMHSLDRHSLCIATEAALGTLPQDVRPIVQSDNGSSYVSRDFKTLLSRKGIAHQRIRPHTPEDNAIVERVEGTIKTALQDYELQGYLHATEVIRGLVDWYNHVRLHSSLDFLQPSIYYRGDPPRVLEVRRAKVGAARLRRKELNLRRRQQTLYTGEGTQALRAPESSRTRQGVLSHFG